VLGLKLRLAQQAPDHEPPLDYRPAGYTAAEALTVMRGYGSEARTTAAALELVDCFYSAAYALLFAGLLGVSLAAIRAPASAHLLNLLPLATAVVDAAENSLMLALLASPNALLAGWVVPLSQLKWKLLFATGSLVGGTGMFCVYKSLTGGRRKRRASGPANVVPGADDDESVRSKARKGTRRA